MSIASSPTRPNLEFAARISDCPFKRAFYALQPGDQVGIQGPMGHFLLDTDRPAVLVAGGIGITALKSMADYASDLRLNTPITLIYGNSAPSEIAYRSELEELVNINPHFEVIHTVSKPDTNWEGRTGRINAQLLREAAARHERPLFYLADSPGMVADTHRILSGLGVSPNQMRFEMYRGYHQDI
jgi:ferredoxin-NADP reductase